MSVVTAWSYSRYADYAQCPLRFKLRHIDRIKEPDSPPLVRGRQVHKQLADYIEGKADELPPVKSEYHRKLYAEMRAWPAEDRVVEQKMGFTATWSPTGYFDKNVWLRAAWDVGLLYADLTGEIVDHKTGKRYASNDEQMEVFAATFFSQYVAARHVTTRLLYIDSGDEETAEFDASESDALRAKWNAKVAPLFVDTQFAPRPNDKCRFCHFAKSRLNMCKFG